MGVAAVKRANGRTQKGYGQTRVKALGSPAGPARGGRAGHSPDPVNDLLTTHAEAPTGPPGGDPTGRDLVLPEAGPERRQFYLPGAASSIPDLFPTVAQPHQLLTLKPAACRQARTPGSEQDQKELLSP